MDIASQSIIRFEPHYDDRLSKLFMVNNDDILDTAYAKSWYDEPEMVQLRNKPSGEPFKYRLIRDPRPTVTVELLARTLKHIDAAHKALLSDDDLIGMLKRRKVGYDSIEQYEMCKTSILYDLVGYWDAVNLSLALHQQFYTVIGSGTLYGVSIPCTYVNHFIGFATRVHHPIQSKFVKYAFTTPRKLCFNIDNAINNDELFMVEGVFDAIAMEHEGYKGAYAIGDSQPSPFQIVVGLKKRLNLCLDNDYAGCIGMLKAALFLKNLGADFKIYLLDGDPDEHILKQGKTIDSRYCITIDDLRSRISALYDPAPLPSWFDHKMARKTDVDFTM